MAIPSRAAAVAAPRPAVAYPRNERKSIHQALFRCDSQLACHNERRNTKASLYIAHQAAYDRREIRPTCESAGSRDTAGPAGSNAPTDAARRGWRRDGRS